ncbi:MAG: hypothetical protein IKH73_07280, partial [Erysipelotrichaceae bacterium]|nr:hypothetical protein [Erysipelotrichaceae bacterium]
VFKWLNTVEDSEHTGIFLDSIDRFSGQLTDTESRFEVIDNLAARTNEVDETEGIMVTMLSVYDYLNAGGSASFLNNGTTYWLVNQDSKGNYYYVDSEGALGVQATKNFQAAVRPVLRFNFAVTATTGKGTRDNPYVITENEITDIGSAVAGQYVLYGDYTYRVVESGNDSTVLIMDGLITKENGDVLKTVYGSDNTYTPQRGVGKYLNTKFLESLPDYENYLVKNTYTFGTYGDFQNYSYLRSYDRSVTCYVGLPNQSTMFLNEYDDYYLAMAGYQDEILIYIKSEPTTMSDFVNKKHAVRPLITMRNDIKILAGTGTKQDPFVILESQLPQSPQEEANDSESNS